MKVFLTRISRRFPFKRSFYVRIIEAVVHASVLEPYRARCPLKGRTYLSKHAAFSCRFL